MEELAAQPPLYLVVARRDARPWTTGSEKDSYQLMADELPELADLVARGYEVEIKLDHYWLYRRLSGKEDARAPESIDRSNL